MTRVIAFLAIILAPAVAAAQSTPSANAPSHPVLPWGFGIMTPAGQIVRDVWVPARTVVADMVIAVPAESTEGDATAIAPTTEPGTEAAPRYAVWRQTVVVPGYWVRRTTAGDYYPRRWTLEQTAAGVYQWRLLPAEVRLTR